MDDEFEVSDELERAIRRLNKGHGYAGIFNYDTAADKQDVELNTVSEWVRSLRAEYGAAPDTLEQNPNDPPDFFVNVAAQRFSVELVQMVDPGHKERAAKGESPFHGKLFLDMIWTKDRFLQKINELVLRKGQKYADRGLRVDVLLIHTAEPWLTLNDARSWLEESIIEPHPQISNVHLLLEYEPGGTGDHWPLLKVYGDSL